MSERITRKGFKYKIVDMTKDEAYEEEGDNSKHLHLKLEGECGS